jgi:hypothetical protein
MRTNNSLIRPNDQNEKFGSDEGSVYKFPSFWELFKVPEYNGIITTLLHEAESKIGEYVSFSDWIEKKIEKEESPDVEEYLGTLHSSTSSYNINNHAVLVWLFKFVFAMDEFWLRRSVFFEFKLNIHRYINRFCSVSGKGKGLYIPQLGQKRKALSALTADGKKQWTDSAKQKVFKMICFLILHEYYFVQEFGKPRKLLEELTDLEWKVIIEHFLLTGAVPIKDMYKEASMHYKVETLLEKFNQITNRIESTLNTGTCLSC